MLDTHNVSRTEFMKALNIRCHKEFGIALNELPDIINIDDNWWQDMTEKDAIIMIDSCIEDIKDELEYKPVHTINAPVYSIDE